MGVQGYGFNTSGYTYGVYGYATRSSLGTGVYGSGVRWGGRFYGSSTSADGVYAQASASSGPAYGVYAITYSTSGRGVFGYAYATSGATYGVYGYARSSSGTGVYGFAPPYGGKFYASTSSGTGVYASAPRYGGRFYASSTSADAVYARATASTGPAWAVNASSSSSSGRGVYAYGRYNGVYGGSQYIGVYGYTSASNNYWAGYFDGDVRVINWLIAGAKAFQIDHPLDPANRYLNHTSVESSEMMNIYSGNVALDRHGEAWVELPEWFGALNGDFRYQLTAIGGSAPNLYIAEGISDNGFKIAGGKRGMTVSWQVTAIRQDAFAEAYPLEVEQDKVGEERGKYLHPEVYGEPAELGIGWADEAEQLQGPELSKEEPTELFEEPFAKEAELGDMELSAPAAPDRLEEEKLDAPPLLDVE
jgi:hypothetical protein